MDTVAVTIGLTDVDEPPDAPDAPRVSATANSNTSLDVSWAAPDNDGRPTITGYDVQWRVVGTEDWTAGPQGVMGTSSVIAGLTASTDYQVQVLARNEDGDGGWSPSGTGRTTTLGNNAPVFSATTLTREVAENTGPNLNIGDVIPAATDADNEDLTYSMEGPDEAAFNFDVSSRQISTTAGVTYDFEATKNSYSVTIRVSDGIDSATVEVTIDVTDVLERPDAPARPTVVATANSNTSLDVSWTVPNNDGRPTITGYDVQWRPATTNIWTDGPQGVTGTSAKITGLRADRRYRVRVRAVNHERSGPFSGARPPLSAPTRRRHTCQRPTKSP